MRKLYVLALVAPVTLLILLGIYVHAGPFRVFEETQMVTTSPPSLMVKTDKTEYSIGEEVRVSIYLVNILDREVILRSRSYGLSIASSEGVVLTYVLFETRASPVDIPSSTSCLIDEWVWNQKDAHRNQVDVGSYTIHVNLLDIEYMGGCVIEIK